MAHDMNDAWYVKVDHTTWETSATPFQKECGLFYVPFDLTKERMMKETRPTA